MKIFRYTVSPFMTNCYLVSVNSSKAVIIDPGGDPEVIVAGLKEHNLEPEAILLTHGHVDHVMAVPALKNEFGVPVLAHNREKSLLEHASDQAILFGLPPVEDFKIDRWLEDGDALQFSGGNFQVLHTPGHSPGSCCFLCEAGLFSGDTLFELSVGRTDLPGGDQEQLFQSIRSRLFKLADDIDVFPGHGEFTSIGREKALNPFLRGVL